MTHPIEFLTDNPERKLTVSLYDNKGTVEFSTISYDEEAWVHLTATQCFALAKFLIDSQSIPLGDPT